MLQLGAAQITLDFKQMFQGMQGDTFLTMTEGLYVGALWALSLWLTPLMVTVGWAARRARGLLQWLGWGLWFGGWGIAAYFLGGGILQTLQLTAVVQETAAYPGLHVCWRGRCPQVQPCSVCSRAGSAPPKAANIALLRLHFLGCSLPGRCLPCWALSSG